jgi:dTDP-4-dehydrorhamnose 3,5-epimerase
VNFQALDMPGAVLVKPEPIADARGHFTRTFCSTEFAQQGLLAAFPQHSISRNRTCGTLRGLHFQRGAAAETKLVSCVRGRLFDVIVDLRRDAGNFGRWLGIELSATGHEALYIPAGCAHGFITLEDDTDVQYLISPEYRPGHGQGLRWDDPEIAIQWPLEPVIMSDADRYAPFLKELS